MFNNLKIYIIIWLISILCCSCSANKNTNYPSRSVVSEKKEINRNIIDQNEINRKVINWDVQKFLGHRCLEIIAEPEKVETYQIDWERQSDNAGNKIHGYPVLQKGRNLNNKEIKAVNKIINSSSSYDFKWSKRIRIRPSYALRFIRHPEKVDIVIDLNTRQWAFYHDNKIMAEDISKSANAELRNIFANLF